MKSSYKNNNVTYHTERDFNLLYINVHPTQQSGGFGRGKVEINRQQISNIGIYDYEKDVVTYLFDKNEDKRIYRFLFEEGYKETESSMAFNAYGNLINNQKIDKRKPADCLFVLAEGKKKETFELWTFSKKGENKKLLKVFGNDTIWKLDVYNQKVVFIQTLPNEVKVEAFDW